MPNTRSLTNGILILPANARSEEKKNKTNVGIYMDGIHKYPSAFDESPIGVEPNVYSRSYSGTAPSSTTAFSRAWLSTQNDFSIRKTK